MIPYQMVTSNGQTNLTAFLNGIPRTITTAHPRFEKVLDLLESGASVEDVQMAFDVTVELDTNLKGAVEIRNGQLYFDNAPLHSKLSDHILQLFHEKDPKWQHLVEFLKNLMLNPSGASRDHLYAWLNNANLTILPGGEFIAYKGVREDGTSVSKGPGVVNGIPMDGHLPNDVGNIVEMRRESVDDNRHVACSVGLHVGNFRYASNFGKRLLTVAVNPRDVVSVPVDSNGEKMRVCRYRVLELAPAEPYTAPNMNDPLDSEESDDEHDDECTCPRCDVW